MKAAFRRVPARATAPAGRLTTFPAPTAGWISNRNLAVNTRNAARVMENWFPQQNSVRARQGWGEHFAFGNDVRSLFVYNSGTIEKMFALSGSYVEDVSNAGASVRVTGLTLFTDTEGFNTAQIRTPGGHFLYACNGVQAPALFDGASWQMVGAASSPIALTGVDTDKLIYPFVFKERLFFIERNSLKAWFLAVKSVGGALSELDLSSVFRRGGKLLMAGSFSSDSGDGLDDRCAFVTDLGEVALYAGTDPGDADAWRLVGVYEIGAPLGARATMRAGGDWVIATREGMVPLSAAIQRDPAALSVAAVTRNIEPDWLAEVGLRTNPWHIEKWDAANLAMVGMPVDGVSSTRPAQCFVVNVETGAWAKWTGVNVGPMAVYGRDLYAAAGGAILKAEAASSDFNGVDGDNYLCRLSYWPDDLGSTAAHKRVMLGRATFTALTTFVPQISVSSNYGVVWPTAPAVSPGIGGGVWDEGLWDTAVWNQLGDYYVQTQWVSIGRSGFAVAPQVQILIGGGTQPAIDLVALDLIHETGSPVV